MSTSLTQTQIKEVIKDIKDKDKKVYVKNYLEKLDVKLNKTQFTKFKTNVKNLVKNLDLKNIPEKLTEEELDDIVSVIPKIPAPFPEISEKNNKNIKKKIKEQLSRYKVVKSGIPYLKNYIYESFVRSVAPGGLAVGVNGATSLSQPLTQIKLNAIHSGGNSGDAGAGMKEFDELSNVSQNKKRNFTFAVFKNPNLTREEIVLNSYSITYISVGTLLSVRPKRMKSIPEEDKWWYDTYFRIFGGNYPEFFPFIRLRLNLAKCYKLQIRMDDIIKSLE